MAMLSASQFTICPPQVQNVKLTKRVAPEYSNNLTFDNHQVQKVMRPCHFSHEAQSKQVMEAPGRLDSSHPIRQEADSDI
jgi:hypothetical protein